jgi:hypothetical protein
MLSTTIRLSALALVTGLCVAAVSPAAGQRAPTRNEDVSVALARGVSHAVTGKRTEVYAPTGETVDMVLPVSAARL